MARLKVTVRQTQTATFDSGDLPANLIRDLLQKADGTFDGNWSLSDVARGGNETWTTDEVIVEEVPSGRSK